CKPFKPCSNSRHCSNSKPSYRPREVGEFILPGNRYGPFRKEKVRLLFTAFGRGQPCSKKRGQAPLCEAPCGPFRQRCLTPFFRASCPKSVGYHNARRWPRIRNLSR